MEESYVEKMLKKALECKKLIEEIKPPTLIWSESESKKMIEPYEVFYGKIKKFNREAFPDEEDLFKYIEYNKKRLKIEEDFKLREAKLQNFYGKDTAESKTSSNLLNIEKANVMKEIEAEILKKNDAFKSWTEQFSSMSVDQLIAFIKLVQAQLAEAVASGTAETEEMKAKREQLTKAATELETKQGKLKPTDSTLWKTLEQSMKMLDTFSQGVALNWKDIFQWSAGTLPAMKSLLDIFLNLSNQSKEISKAFADGVSATTDKVSKSISDIDMPGGKPDAPSGKSDNVADGVKKVDNKEELATSVMSGFSKASAVLGAAQAAYTIVTSMIKFFDGKVEEEIMKEEKGIKNLKNEYEKLGREINNTYNDEVYDKMNSQNDKLKEQSEAIERQVGLEKRKKQSDDDRVEEWRQQQESLKEQIQENERKQMEMLAGTTVRSAIDTFADALVEAYARGEDGAVAMGETTKKVMANAVKEALKKKLLADAMEKAVEGLADSMADGELTQDDQNRFKAEVDLARKQFMAGLAAYDEMFKEDVESQKAAGLKGEISASITEVTASLLEGHIRAMLDRVIEIRSNSAMQFVELQNGFLSVKGILESTKQIEINTGRSANGVDSLNAVASEMKGYLCEIRDNTQSRFYK